MQKLFFRVFGVAGTCLAVYLYIGAPSFPTPDKLLILSLFLGMIFGQAIELTKRLLPFVLLLAVYDFFRGFADYLNTNVNYMFMPIADKLLFFGTLPTKALQDVFWAGTVQWYDYFLYVMYMMHYVFPVLLAVVVWKKWPQHYWRMITAFVLVSFAGFATFALFPAAPPWMATQAGVIEPIRRVSTDIWYALGVQDFPSLYTQISPNAVAAVPSLHAAYATMICMFVFFLTKSRWRYISLIYPAAIYFGTVYMGEHYVIDEILGAAFGAAAFYASAPAWAYVRKYARAGRKAYRQRRLALAFDREE
jgi:hypothetical protein